MSLTSNQTVGITYGTSTANTIGTDYSLWKTTSSMTISLNENNLAIETNDGNKSLNEAKQ